MSFRRKPESRVPGENRDPVFEMVPDFRRDDVWMPPYQVRGRLLKSGMTEKGVYGQTLILQRIFFVIPVKTGIQHVYGYQNPNWIPAFAGMTDGAVALFVGTVAFF